MTSKRSISDLPSAAISNLIKFARGNRFIAGTNTYALVCKTWRDAGESGSDDEQLQLFMDLASLPPTQIKSAASWLAAHGKHIDLLEIMDIGRFDAKAVLRYPNFGSNLQHLVLDGPNSLAGLLEAKVQLPALKHLGAHLSQYFNVERQPDPQASSSVKGERQQADSSERASQQSSGWEDSQQFSGSEPERTQHTLQETCPALLKLDLGILGETPDARSSIINETLAGFLPRLLPPTLQQLRLRWLDTGTIAYMTGAKRIFKPLTGLQHLQLWNVVMDTELVAEIPPQCTLQLVDCRGDHFNGEPGCWVDLHPSLTALSLPHDNRGSYQALAELTGLTSLTMNLREASSEQPGLGPVLACLTGLQQLNLSATKHGAEEELLEALAHVAGTSSLRRLALTTANCSSWDLLAAVSALTQLTACVWRSTEPAVGQGIAWQQQEQAGEVQGYGVGAGMGVGWAPLHGAGGGPLQALQHLVGLRQLQLSAPALLNHASGWLRGLTQLTLLAVSCEGLQQQWSPDNKQEQVDGCVAAMVPRLQLSCPPSLQQVVLYMRGVPISCVEPSPLPGVSLRVQEQQEWEWQVVPQGPRSMQPCPHLRGVWELLE